MQYKGADAARQKTIYQFYLSNITHVNNWNLVDSSAHHIVGAHLWRQDHHILFKLAASNNLWQRRIAIVATWYFIKQQHFACTLKLTQQLMADSEDLIHKACGWMLREVGKQDEPLLLNFLDRYCTHMPRTMLRYAIERLPAPLRQHYLTRGTMLTAH